MGVNWYVSFLRDEPLVEIETLKRQFCQKIHNVKSDDKIITKMSKIKQFNYKIVDNY